MANLTQQEFLAIADIYPYNLNVWCTEDTPVTVLGVTVPLIDSDGISVANTLQQVQTLIIPIDNDTAASIQLSIITRVLLGTSPNSYYFFTVQPLDADDYVDPNANEVMQNGQVVLLPNLRNGSFFTSEYNVLLNNAQENRQSDYLTISTSTTYAQIQDSLYSDTGWTNGRYTGTVTNRDNYASIDSAIIGSSFEGTYYPITIKDSEITNTEISERSYLEYFHTDLATYPTYSLDVPTLFTIKGTQTDLLSTTILTEPITGNNKPFKLYKPGDVLLVQDSSEILKVQSMVRYSAAEDYIITVIRGWNNTTPATLTDNKELTRVRTVRLYELEGNKPSPVKRGKIRIKDTGYIVHLDRSGYIISGSVPPTV